MAETSDSTTYPLNLLRAVNQHIRALNSLPDPKSIHRQSFASSMKAMRRDIPLIDLTSPLSSDRLAGVRRALSFLDQEMVELIQLRYVEGLPFDPFSQYQCMRPDSGRKLLSKTLYRLTGEDLIPCLRLGEAGAKDYFAKEKEKLLALLPECRSRGSYDPVPADLLHLGPFVHNMLRFYRFDTLGDLLTKMQDPLWADHCYGLSKYRKQIAFCLLKLEVIGLNHPVFQKPRLRMLQGIPRADFPHFWIYEAGQKIPSNYKEQVVWAKLFVDLLETLKSHSDHYLIPESEVEVLDRNIQELISRLQELLDTSPEIGKAVGETMLTIFYYLASEDREIPLRWIRTLCGLLGYRPLYRGGGVCVSYPFEPIAEKV